jgi:NADH-quinone oxidoreductase subunit K
MIPVEHYLAFGLVLFVIGAGGALLRRNPVVILMSIELMLTAVNVNLIAFSRMWGAVHGQLFSIFIMADAAAQTALALGIVVACSARPRIPAVAGDKRAETDESVSDLAPAQPVASDAEEVDSYAERLQP